MGASERLSLLIEARTSGEPEVAKLEESINRVISAAERTTKAVAAGLFLGQKFVEYRGGLDSIRDGLRGVELGWAAATSRAALFGTAAVAGITLAAEATIKLANNQAKAIRSTAELSAKLNQVFTSVQTFQTLSKTTGQDLNFLSKFPVDQARAFILELEKIPDPLARAQRATTVFGADAGQALAVLDKGLAQQIDRSHELAQSLTADARIAVDHMRREFAAFEDFNPFPKLLQRFRLMKNEFSQGLTIKVAFAMQGFEKNVPRTPGSDFSGGELGPGIGATPEPGFYLPKYEDFRRMASQDIFAPKAPGLPSISTLTQRLNATFAANARTSTLEGLQSSRGEAERRAGELSSLVRGGGSGADLASVELLQTENLIRNLDARIDALQKAKQKADELKALENDLGNRLFDISLRGKTPAQQDQARAVRRFGTGVEGQFAPFLIQEFEDRNAAGIASARAQLFDFKIPGFNAPNEESEKRARLFSSSLSRSISEESEKLSNLRQVIGDVSKIQDENVDRQARIIELLAGPGGEIAALQQILALRLDLAERGNDAAAAERARFDFTVKILEKQKEAQREAKEIDGRIFDALVGRGAGLRGFASSFALSTGRTVFQNFNEQFRTSIGSRLSVPGQGTVDNPSFLGKLLKGTPFGLAPIDANTAATIANTKASDALTAALGGTPSFGGGTVGSLVDGASSFFGFKQKLDSRVGNAGGATVPIVNELGDIEGYVAAAPAGSSKLGKGIGIAGAAAAGFFGTKAGIDQGGVRGGLTAAGSLSGAAGAILGLAGVSGPAAPILAGVGLGLGLISSFLPDPKKLRDEFITRTLDSGTYSSPQAQGIGLTRMGEGFDYNLRGEMRPIIVNVKVDAMDAKSLMDRRGDIAEAVRGALQEGHAVNDEIRGLTNAA